MGGLEETTRGEQFGFGERRPDEMETDRQMAGLAAGHRDRREAGQVGGNREDVLEVKLEGIRSLLADLEGRRRDRRGEQHVDASEGGEVFGPDLRAGAEGST